MPALGPELASFIPNPFLYLVPEDIIHANSISNIPSDNLQYHPYIF